MNATDVSSSMSTLAGLVSEAKVALQCAVVAGAPRPELAAKHLDRCDRATVAARALIEAQHLEAEHIPFETAANLRISEVASARLRRKWGLPCTG